MDRVSEVVIAVDVPGGLVTSLFERGELGGLWLQRGGGPGAWARGKLVIRRRERALYMVRPELGESVFSDFRHPEHEPDAWYPEPMEASFQGFSLSYGGARELVFAAHFPSDPEALRAVARSLGL